MPGFRHPVACVDAITFTRSRTQHDFRFRLRTAATVDPPTVGDVIGNISTRGVSGSASGPVFILTLRIVRGGATAISREAQADYPVGQVSLFDPPSSQIVTGHKA